MSAHRNQEVLSGYPQALPPPLYLRLAGQIISRKQQSWVGKEEWTTWGCNDKFPENLPSYA